MYWHAEALIPGRPVFTAGESSCVHSQEDKATFLPPAPLPACRPPRGVRDGGRAFSVPAERPPLGPEPSPLLRAVPSVGGPRVTAEGWPPRWGHALRDRADLGLGGALLFASLLHLVEEKKRKILRGVQAHRESCCSAFYLFLSSIIFLIKKMTFVEQNQDKIEKKIKRPVIPTQRTALCFWLYIFSKLLNTCVHILSGIRVFCVWNCILIVQCNPKFIFCVLVYP